MNSIIIPVGNKLYIEFEENKELEKGFRDNKESNI